MSITSQIIIITLALLGLSFIQFLFLQNRKLSARQVVIISFLSWLGGWLLVFVGITITFGPQVGITELLYGIAAGALPSVFNLRSQLNLLKYDEYITTAKALDWLNGGRE